MGGGGKRGGAFLVLVEEDELSDLETLSEGWYFSLPALACQGLSFLSFFHFSPFLVSEDSCCGLLLLLTARVTPDDVRMLWRLCPYQTLWLSVRSCFSPLVCQPVRLPICVFVSP